MNRTLLMAQEYTRSDYKLILEFGVFKGRTIKQLRNQFDNSFRVCGFDSFEGLPEDWTGTTHKKGGLSAKGQIPNIPGCSFFKGWFSESIVQFKNKFPVQPIALLHIDSDLYSSAIDVLYGLKKYIQEGTVIVFDEWVYNHKDIPENRQHEQKAFYEWANEFDVEYELIPRINDYAEMERQIVLIKGKGNL